MIDGVKVDGQGRVVMADHQVALVKFGLFCTGAVVVLALYRQTIG
jgi:hypothetical protein